MKTFSLLVLVGLFSIQAHAGKLEIAEAGNRVTKAGVLSLSTSWIKDKGKKWDIGLKIKNESSGDIIVNAQDSACWRGGVTGETSAGDNVIALRAGQMKEVRFTCKLAEKAKGPYKLTVTRVFENPGGDGKTVGKVIGTDIAWQVDIAQ